MGSLAACDVLSGWLLFRNLFPGFIRLLRGFGYNEMYFRNKLP
jgi:hypothetical protein